MPSALLSASHGQGAPHLFQDLQQAGIEPVALEDRSMLVQDVIRREADYLVCFEPFPDDAFFDSTAAIGRLAPLPVVVFTPDRDAEKIERAVRCSVHVYAVDGYHPARLRPLLHLARARFAQERGLRAELDELRQRFDERKLVDRAKGILMGARQLREEEAFRVLRSAAMASKQRIGQLSRSVIDAAQFAEAINRAGQLRMLSQRLVKLYALSCTATSPEDTRRLLAASLAAVEDVSSRLERSLSRPTMGDLLDGLAEPWAQMREVLRAPVSAARLAELDAQAEMFLQRAERLTANLEVAAFAGELRVINVSGRQRMLSQRLAEEALIAAVLGRRGTAAPGPDSAAAGEFAQGLAYLGSLPLGNDSIRRQLEDAAKIWPAFREALDQAGTGEGRARIAALSETLLAQFEQLTDEFERAMQMLVG